MTKPNSQLKIGVVVPHVFMNEDVLPHVIFSPGYLAIELVNKLNDLGIDVTLFSPGSVQVDCQNITSDLSLFEQELETRHDTYLSLLKKHPLTFITLARQIQSELIAKAFTYANEGNLDIVHVFTNEEELGLVFANLCVKPVLFTHHDPYNFLTRYKTLMPKYKHLNWVSISYSQRAQMPADTNWMGNVYNGITVEALRPVTSPQADYLVFMGRLIEPKGVHLAIEAVRLYNKTRATKLKLVIAGKHYGGHEKDAYWEEKIKPYLSSDIVYRGFIDDVSEQQGLLGNAIATLMPSTFEEPFGMVAIESLACGTPVIALDSGGLPEIINSRNGLIIKKSYINDFELDTQRVVKDISQAIDDVSKIDREGCRLDYEERFTGEIMANNYLAVYERLL